VGLIGLIGPGWGVLCPRYVERGAPLGPRVGVARRRRLVNPS